VNEQEIPPRRAAASLYAALALAFVVLAIVPLYLSPQLAPALGGVALQAEREHIALPVCIVFFTLASFIGAPQPLLVGAAVLAAGPQAGFWYAWISTIIAGGANYSFGRAAHDYARKRIDGFARWRWTHFIRRKPFLASTLIRAVPTAPFVVVNMAFGVARANAWGFIAGLALGSLPKTAIIAFAGKGVLDAIEGELGWSALIAAVVLLLWLAAGVVLRKIQADRYF
jgi:uncharacterized membrane protein YdjX (TVP38/TMEM64 family)